MSELNASIVRPEGETRPPPERWLRSSLRLLRDAVRGAPVDLTAAPIGTSLTMLAVPMILEMVMESIFAMADVFWVAHLGATAVAAVGLTESMMMIVYSLAMGVSIGAMALVARRVGEKNIDAAARTAVQAIALGLAIALALGAAGAAFAPALLRLMGADAGVVAQGTSFTRVMLGCNATAFLLFLINAIFRGAGDAAQAMRVLWLGNALNIALGPCLIFGLGPFPALGVTGAAVATNIGRGCAVAYQLVVLTRGRGRITLTRKHLSLDVRVMGSVLRLSSSATLQTLISMTSYIGVMRILSSFGSAPLAGYTIGFRILMFAILPAFGLSNAAATLVGQNLGAGRADRAERSVWRASFASAAFLSAVGLFFFVGAALIVGIFTADPEVLRYGIGYLRIVSLGFPFYAFGMVASQSLNGAGDTMTPTVINVFVFLDAADASRVGPVAPYAARTERRLHHAGHLLLGVRRRLGGGLSRRPVEANAGLKRSEVITVWIFAPPARRLPIGSIFPPRSAVAAREQVLRARLEGAETRHDETEGIGQPTDRVEREAGFRCPVSPGPRGRSAARASTDRHVPACARTSCDQHPRAARRAIARSPSP
jgi:putative MATE family efflux protein